jgi:glycosyltransferase involved in cell wall biosynthesis
VALRVALVHDWLTGMRGGERVLEALCERFPRADLFTLLHVPGSVSPLIEQRPIHTTTLQRLPGSRQHYRNYLPLFPLLIRELDLTGFDLVISSSHCVAKSVIAPPGATHICYCHTPMRYAWDQFDQYFGPARVGWLASAGLRPILGALARWDRATAGRVGRYLTNSHHVAGRIHRYYNREATVVYPPVNTRFYHPDGAARERYALVVSALVPYKRLDVAIDACTAARMPLKIVGTGPERSRLARLASGDTTFLGQISNEDIRELYRRAALVLLPGEEDFGIVPVEAQACGRPVVAYGRGGALETVIDGETGILVNEQTPEAFAAAISDAFDRPFDRSVLRKNAERFSPERFRDELEQVLMSVEGPA